MKFFQLLPLVVITTVVVTGGCDSAKPEADKGTGSPSSGKHTHADGTVHHNHGDGHTHGEGPHGGVVSDWGGGKYHVEFTVDHDKQEATVYILGDDEKTAVPVDAAEIIVAIKDPAFQVVLQASPQAGDPEGTASRFVGNHESLGIVREFEGSISAVVSGTPYSGNFKEEAHDHE